MKTLFTGVIFALAFNFGFAQIKNAVTTTATVYGNCGMCKTTIEKAGNIKKQAQVEWNKNTDIATITYDSKKTSKEAVLKRIAEAGYDNELFLAPDDVYASLPGCCHYDRVKKSGDGNVSITMAGDTKIEMKMQSQGLQGMFDAYFNIKDALILSDVEKSKQTAQAFGQAISGVDMASLKHDLHMAYMKELSALKAESKAIAQSNDLAQQRKSFSALTQSVYKLVKLAEKDGPVYFQHCPMYNNGDGGDWLSKESKIKNPYFGSQMLSCGKTVETIE